MSTSFPASGSAPRTVLAILAAGLVGVATCAPAAAVSKKEIREGNGFDYYVQESSPDRHRTRSDGTETFELRAGDCDWQKRAAKGKISKDCKTHRERVEVRSLTTDRIGETVCYHMELMLPANYPEMSPKQTLGQWHNGKYDTFRNRYENGVFEMAVNYKHELTHRVRIPFRKGRWNTLDYRFTWGQVGSAEAWLGGRKVVDLQDIDLLQRNVKQLYFKYGVYRSDMDKWNGIGTPPTQAASYRNVSRYTGARCLARR